MSGNKVTNEVTIDAWKEGALVELREYQYYSDYETAHWLADKVLLRVLRQLGHDDIATAFESVPRWYA